MVVIPRVWPERPPESVDPYDLYPPISSDSDFNPSDANFRGKREPPTTGVKNVNGNNGIKK